jgi:hypothetical protein
VGEQVRAYAHVSPVFWTRGTGKRLRGNKDAQILAVYLMTCGQSSMVGIFNLAIPTMAHETGLTADEVRHALDALAHERFAHFDEDEELVWLPSSARIQVGETLTRSDKRRQQLIKQLSVFGHHKFAGEFLETYAGPYCLTDEPILKGHRRGIEGASRVRTRDPHAPCKGHPRYETKPGCPTDGCPCYCYCF